MYTEEIRHLDLLEVLDASFDGVIISDAAGKVLYINRSACAIMQVEESQMLGKGIEELLREKIIPQSTGMHAMQTKQPFTRLQKYENGKMALVTSSVLENHSHEQYILTNIRDITILYRFLDQREEPDLAAEGVVSYSEKISEVLGIARMVSAVKSTVLIQGETGTGKDVVARYIHRCGSKSDDRFIKINCGGQPEALLESELFGYEPGAFTGASKGGKVGLVERADGGTLFLDEIGDLPMSLQPKLLELLQDFQFHRIGGTAKHKVDIRVIAATNKNLWEAVERKEFREDLYFRLNVVPIHVPPLRDRRDDIIPLTKFFLSKFMDKYGLRKELAQDVYSAFLQYDWPGNVRELSNTVERLLVTSPDYLITSDCLPWLAPNAAGKSTVGMVSDLKQAVEETERKAIRAALNCGMNSYQIARALHISQATAYRKIQKYSREG
ncbi:MAG: sigma 54-interacting transcriptional regulator [Bacillota bacterium]